MIGYSTITQKGQITIPIDIRRALGLDIGKPVVIVQEKGAAVVKPASGFFALRGSLKPTKRPEKFVSMRKAFKKHLESRKRT